MAEKIRANIEQDHSHRGARIVVTFDLFGAPAPKSTPEAASRTAA